MLSRLLVCAAVVVMHRRTQVPSVNKLELHRHERDLEPDGTLMGGAAVCEVSICKMCRAIFPEAGTGKSGGLLSDQFR